MRSLFSFGESKEIDLAISGAGSRPETLRRKMLAENSLLFLIVSALLMPVAVYVAVAGSYLPLLVAALTLFCGVATLAMHRRGRFEEAVSGQVCVLLAVGLILTLADRDLADGGLAIALLGPVHASLLARPRLRSLSWIMLFGVVALAAIAAAFGAAPILAGPLPLGPVSIVIFVLGAAMVARTANTIGTGYEMHDKSELLAYRHLVEHVQDAVIRFSSAGDMLFLSRSSERLFGCRRYELTGSGLGERIHVLDKPIYLTAFADANQGGQPRVIEVRMRQDDPQASMRVPKFIWVEISLSPVAGNQVNAQRFEVVALLRDVTERRDQAIEMAKARQSAEEASATKSRFLATIGHELRTPLNAVVGFSEMMTSGIGGDLSPTHAEYAGLIHQSGTHLLEVVRMLLDMSRIEAGKFELHAEAFAPQDLIEPCLKMVEAVAAKRGITVETDLARGLPQMVGDERACRQILINLLSNAIKFSHDGGVVNVSVRRRGQHLNLSVTDNGIGMTQEAIGRIGEPFFQANGGLARRYEGTGLGLSIVKGLVDLHEGTLRAVSEYGAGTTVTVLLPLNGPAIKLAETATVTPLHPEPVPTQIIPWQDEKRKAQ